MAKHAGKNLLLKIESATPGTYTTIAGQRSTSFSINNEQIDVTDKDDSRWRKLLAGGVRSMSLSSSGLLQSASAHGALVTASTDGTIDNYQIIFADGLTFSGPFQISSFEGSGEYTDAQQYSITLESAGDITTDITP